MEQKQLSQNFVNLLIVLAVTAVCFIVGGGLNLRHTSLASLHDYIYYRNDTLDDKIFAAAIIFWYSGCAAAFAGAVMITVTLFLIQRKKRS